jgi:hypothetical protein
MIINKFDMLKSLLSDEIKKSDNFNLTVKDLFRYMDTVDMKIENQKTAQKEHYKDAIRKAARIENKENKEHKE